MAKVLYLCDEQACEKCRSNAKDCSHTADIKHAVNFEEKSEGIFVEKDTLPALHIGVVFIAITEFYTNSKILVNVKSIDSMQETFASTDGSPMTEIYTKSMTIIAKQRIDEVIKLIEEAL